MSFLDVVRRGARSNPYIDYGYGSSSSFLRLGGTGKQWEVGDLNANGVVAICSSVIVDKIGQGAPIAASSEKFGGFKKDDSRTVMFNNCFVAPFDTITTFSILAVSLKLYGMAYLLKTRVGGPGSKVIGYTPFMKPQVSFDAVGGVPRWKFKLHGGSGKERVALEEDVIVLRYGVPDPRNPLNFNSPLLSLIRTVATDNECDNFLASVLTNGGVPSHIISPESPVERGKQSEWRQRIVEALTRFTRDGRGFAWPMPEPIKVTNLAFDPSQMQIVEIDKIAITKLCAAMGVDPMAASLPSENRTYANYGEARKALVEDTILPLWKLMLEQIEPHLRSDQVWVGSTAGVSLVCDRSLYPEVSDDKFKIAAEVREDFKTGIITRGEARAARGLQGDLNDARLYQDIIAASRPGTRALSVTARARLEELHARLDQES